VIGLPCRQGEKKGKVAAVGAREGRKKEIKRTLVGTTWKRPAPVKGVRRRTPNG